MSTQKTKSRPTRGRAATVAPPPRPAVDPAAEAARRAARLERQEQARLALAARRRRQLLRNIGIAAAVVLVVGGAIGYAMWKDASLPGQSMPQEPSPHLISKDAPHLPYLSDPPTSGPHVAEVPPWGVQTTPLPKELQVHGLEDGGVVVNYKPDLDSATVSKLVAIVSGYPTQVILSPYPGLSDPIVVTAWNRIERFPQFNEPELRRFIEAFRGIDHHGQSGT